MIRTLRSPKTTDRTPTGRESWNGTLNQVEGNLEWMLEFLSPEEIIELTADIVFTADSSGSNLSRTYRNLQGLAYYHRQMEKLCHDQINQIDQVLAEEDIDLDSLAEEALQINSGSVCHTLTRVLNKNRGV
jgi:hypothetical protein